VVWVSPFAEHFLGQADLPAGVAHDEPQVLRDVVDGLRLSLPAVPWPELGVRRLLLPIA
jgi:hypothetical protein